MTDSITVEKSHIRKTNYIFTVTEGRMCRVFILHLFCTYGPRRSRTTGSPSPWTCWAACAGGRTPLESSGRTRPEVSGRCTTRSWSAPTPEGKPSLCCAPGLTTNTQPVRFRHKIHKENIKKPPQDLITWLHHIKFDCLCRRVQSCRGTSHICEWYVTPNMWFYFPVMTQQ